MRYIDISKIDLPKDWVEKADALTKKLKDALTEEDRNIIIKKNEIWKELFIPLHNLSNGKCWYSEALDVMSDRDIDHFRPKNKSKNIDDIPRLDEDGYWWLCYDYENYRFSSQYSNEPRKDKFKSKKNTGGKWFYFPLFENSTVAKNKTRCKDEEIMLLDPCDQDDPYLLTFDSKGKALPNSNAIFNENDKRRVLTSIRLYHLDHKPLEELREQTWDFCQRMIDEIRNISTNPEGLSISDKSRVKFLKDEIRRLTSRSISLSAVAIACCEDNGLSILAEAR
jgi:uncharacterized protein (TIGR02646 family)